MSKLQELLDKVKDTPKAAIGVVEKLMDGVDLSKTVEIEVPEKYASVFEQFNKSEAELKKAAEAGEDILSGVKEVSLSKLSKEFKGDGKKVTVKLDLKKVKKIISTSIKKLPEKSEGKKKASDDESDEMNESFSLFQEAPSSVAAANATLLTQVASAGVNVGITVGIGIAVGWMLAIAIMVYVLYVMALCYQRDDWVFDEGQGTGNIMLSFATMTFLPLIWAFVMHMKFKKADGGTSKKDSKNEAAEDDSVLAGFEPMTEFVSDDPAIDTDGVNDQTLINAYRLVLSDLKHRSPNGQVPYPLKEESEPEGTAELSVDSNSGDEPEDDSVLA
jgi:hypothetical protein